MTASNEDPPPVPPGELDDFFRILDRLPFLGSLKGDLMLLRRLLYDRRTPRVVAIGAHGSGRTSLANALLGRPALPLDESTVPPRDGWVRIDASGRHLDWLELESGPLDGGRLIDVRRAVEETSPDVVLLVLGADEESEAARRIGETLEPLLSVIAERHPSKPTIVPVLARVDRAVAVSLEASAGVRIEADERAKLESRIEAARGALDGATKQRLRRPIAVIAGGDHTSEAHPSWNLEALANAIEAAMPEEAKIEAARSLGVAAEKRRDLARTIVNRCAAAAVTIGLMPLPFADTVLLLPLQGVMISAIAYLSGQPWDRRATLEWLSSVGIVGGVAFGLRWGAQQLLKLVPGAGTLVAGSVAGAGTMAMGRSAIAYFVDGPGQRAPRWRLPTPRAEVAPEGSPPS